MKERLISKLENASSAVKYWWLLLIAGILVILLGIITFINPIATYVFDSILFGCIVLVMGIFSIIFSVSIRKKLVGWGWYLAGGILETIFGIWLLSYPPALGMALPIFLGVWLMFAGISAIMSASDLQSWGVKGTGWSIFAGILLVICSLIILWYPLIAGVVTSLFIIGFGLLIFGIQLVMDSFTMQKVHHHFKEIHKELTGEADPKK